MAQLKRLSIRGYKSIYALEDFELRSLNVLIGANGAGKSNFISLFRMLADVAEQRLQLFVQIEGGADALLFGTRKRTAKMDVTVEFGANGYQFSLEPSGDRLIFASEEMLSIVGAATLPGRSINIYGVGAGNAETKLPEVAQGPFMPYARKAIGAWRVYHFHDTSRSAPVRAPQAVRDNLRLKSDGGNLAPFLRHLRERYSECYERIVQTVRMVAPFFGGFVYRSDPGERIELEWFEADDADTPLGVRQMSDGTLRFICLATLLLQPPELRPDTILIDEPELGLHPYALAVVASLLQQAAETRQLVVSTQSIELINEFQPEDVIVVDRRDGASTFKRLDEQELADWLKDYGLGELWERNILGGGPAR
jgi:predicted ATPase